MPVDFTRYAVGGASRPDSFSGMSPDFSSALGQLLQAAPAGVQVSSGYRSPERQAQLWQDAIQKYGNADTARKWVAPPGRSRHNHGKAADLKFLNDTARSWVHANAQRFGLAFPLANENWHVEMAGDRGHQHAAPTAADVPARFIPPTAALGDVVTPPTVQPTAPGPDLGSVVATFMQSRQQRDEAAAADKARKQALFGGGLADLYG